MKKRLLATVLAGAMVLSMARHLPLALMPAFRHMVIRRMASMSVLTWIWRRKSVTEMVGNL